MKLLTRNEIDNKYKWNIENLYKDIDEWELDLEKVKIQLPELGAFAGKINNNENLLTYIEKDIQVSRILDKLRSYAYLRADEDTSKAEFQVIKGKINSCLSESASISAFFIPELLGLPHGSVEKFIEESEELKIYEFYLKNILSEKPHILSAEQENIISLFSDTLCASESTYDIFTSSDIAFPKIKYENGDEVELTSGNYSIFMNSKNREVRKAAFKTYHDTYNKSRNMLATLFMSNVNMVTVDAKIRNYKSSLESCLKPNNISVEVYNNLIDTVSKNLSSFHRYIKLKKKLLNLDEIHMYDLAVPIVDIEESKIKYEEAIEICLEAIKPLGEEYSNIFKEGIKERWIDVFENKGKCTGGYSRGCYDSMPYILLNYNYLLGEVFGLIHEMGHSIHSYYSRKNQPYIYSRYAWFCAEIASHTNEALLRAHLIKKAKDKKEKLYFINKELDSIRWQVFTRTMFAEFEKIIHENIESNNPLSTDDLCKIYHDLNVKYFGPDMVLDKEGDIGWATIPHFYANFYVYQYATGLVAGTAISKMLIEEGESAVERYKEFLKSGGSNYPIELLNKVGIDMTTPKPLEDTIKRFDELLDMMEKELGSE
ncbi:oligoendopeptidase F [Clostridium hydrogeniformans]|uniref:oligoendopeptidase F n=1 Tax=Clostridium hydrogeniformans TaxID=349933 RepID=UPI000485CADE|nr:oligoendopeptidase F [Clostridium hydrogeniformans]